MIGRLQGTLIEKQAPYITVETSGGVGYELETSLTTFSRLPSVGESVTLYTHLVVREDALFLCGFFTEDERTLFRSLIRVSGVGPKLALSVLSGMSPEQFFRCVEGHDTHALLKISGIGRKTAERLLLEMEDKLPSLTRGGQRDKLPFWTNAFLNIRAPYKEAVEALVALGYRQEEAFRVVSEVEQPELTSEQLIRRALNWKKEGTFRESH
ncbi:MAG: Holliday junction branch migration protein RuvA [Gammaproteobacteria bacterium]|nr:Holliday junction branch migration protein RuvA [Gammaproteobacteria bacterium]